jgi:hypothetical protein
MRWKEKLYERPLKRPIDEKTRVAIHSELHRRRGQLPIPTELSWNGAGPELTIRSQWISFIVLFMPERMVVNAELSLAAKMFATDENRRHAVQFIESMANDLNL